MHKLQQDRPERRSTEFPASTAASTTTVHGATDRTASAPGPESKASPSAASRSQRPPASAPAGGRLRVVVVLVALVALLASCDLITPPPANVAPTAAFSVTPLSGDAPLTVNVDASASSDTDGTIAKYSWKVTGPSTASATGKTASFTFDAIGTYTIELTVTDDDSATATTSKDVRVGLPNQQPTASFTATPTAGPGPLTVAVDASASTDPDGTIAGYAWSTDTGETATGVTASFTFTDPGNHAIHLTVTDDRGGTDSTSEIVNVHFPPATAGFRIDLLFADPTVFSSVERQAFEDAATRWSQVITGDLEDTQLDAMPANYCGGGENAVASMPVDDLVIQVMLAPIDGEYGVVAFAGPCRLRTSGPDNGLTKYGIMVFDTADATRMSGEGTLSATVLHEMGHVLGIGTLWQNPNNLLAWEPQGTPCETATFTTTPHYLGAGGNAGYGVAGGSGDVPVEEDGGAGTRCGHWDEGILDNEIMTGWIEAAGTSMPLSQVTAGSLQDIGYTVSMAATDAYTLPVCAPNCTNLRTQGLGERLHEIPIYPVPEDRPTERP